LLGRQKVLSKDYFSAKVFNLYVRFGISWSQRLVRGKILVLYCRRNIRAIVDYLEKKPIEEALIQRNSMTWYRWKP
jgi:hypothetical protein